MVITNGFPKAGNHALVKAMQLLGQPCAVQHIPCMVGISFADPHIFIKRDPRNIICSWLRFNRKPVTPGMFISAFRDFGNGFGFVEDMARYEGWLFDPSVIVTRYEDLIASDAEMRRLADAVGTPYIDGAFEALPGLTATWFADHSDYRTIWTPEVDAVWSAEGGPELLTRWGC
jgi:hypothetical protein